MIRIAIVTAAGVCALAACSSSGSSSNSAPSSAAPPAGSSGRAQPGIALSAVGGVLVAPDGHALYFNDAESGSRTSCTGTCVSEWPPVGGPVMAAGGVDASALGTRTRPDGTMQATYQGHALYEFDEDKSPSDHKGDGFKDEGGTWHLASVGGGSSAPARKAPTTGVMTPSSATSSSLPGYTY
jgi:predicted lipoprotein with Yx(FWY)xxD motif